MENLIKELENKFKDNTICDEDFIRLIKRIDETAPSRYLDVYTLIDNILQDEKRQKKNFLELLRSEVLYEFLLDSNVHVGIFAATAFIYYKHYNTKLKAALPDFEHLKSNDGQNAFNFILHEIMKAEGVL